MMNRSYNTLIAGTIGAGKSWTEEKILDALMNQGGNMFVLLDPKKVELYGYKDRVGVLQYADNEEDIFEALTFCFELMTDRNETARAKGMKTTDEPHVFIFCDEMAFIMQSKRKKEYVRMMSQIVLLGRSARVHLILCTQVATQDVIPACIRDNMTNIVCLRQRDAGKYRYLLGEFPGRLPAIGKAYVLTPDMMEPAKVDAGEVWNLIA